LRAVHARFADALESVRPDVEYDPRPRYGFDWTPRFAIHRSAWHAIDHAWELEDRVPAKTRRPSPGRA
jgi:hypothetical protein